MAKHTKAGAARRSVSATAAELNLVETDPPIVDPDDGSHDLHIRVNRIVDLRVRTKASELVIISVALVAFIAAICVMGVRPQDRVMIFAALASIEIPCWISVGCLLVRHGRRP